MCQVAWGGDQTDTKQPQIMTNGVYAQTLSFLAFLITSAWTLWFSSERLAPQKEGRKNRLTVLKTKQNSTKALSSSRTIPMESKERAHSELPDCNTMRLLCKGLSFLPSQSKHGSEGLLKSLKRMWSSDSRPRQRNLRLKGMFFLGNQKQGFRREPLFSKYVPSEIRCPDIHWWARRPCPAAFSRVLEGRSWFGSQDISTSQHFF